MIEFVEVGEGDEVTVTVLVVDGLTDGVSEGEAHVSKVIRKVVKHKGPLGSLFRIKRNQSPIGLTPINSQKLPLSLIHISIDIWITINC